MSTTLLVSTAQAGHQPSQELLADQINAHLEAASKSAEAAGSIVKYAIGVQQGFTVTTSGSAAPHAFHTAVVGSGVVTNIGQLLYDANTKAAASAPQPEIMKQPVVFGHPKLTDPGIRALPAGLFTLLQAWEGVVTSVTNDAFVARVRDRTTKSNPDEEVTLSREEVTPSEQDQIIAGAIFYWSIGYKDAPGEPRRRVSQIRFRRLPAWSDAEIATANAYAKVLRNTLLGKK